MKARRIIVMTAPRTSHHDRRKRRDYRQRFTSRILIKYHKDRAIMAIMGYRTTFVLVLITVSLAGALAAKKGPKVTNKVTMCHS